MTTACALVSYFYGFDLQYIAGMTLYQFKVYMQEIGNIMKLFNGQAPAKKPADIRREAQALGLVGPNG